MLIISTFNQTNPYFQHQQQNFQSYYPAGVSFSIFYLFKILDTTTTGYDPRFNHKPLL
jgi:hypothetical protein